MSLATYSAKIARSLDSEKITMVISGGGQEILRGTKSTSQPYIAVLKETLFNPDEIMTFMG
jgi:hypothetical protein